MHGAGPGSVETDHEGRPEPLEPGEAVGQHLSVVRLLRLAQGRTIYLVHNKSRKWRNRKCWNCGNVHAPERAQSCDFCMTPLRDLNFVMTSRFDPARFDGFMQLARLRIDYQGLITPVAVLIKRGRMLSVYHDNGERLLLDEPSPLPGPVVLRMAWMLADTLWFLHQLGVVLGPFGTHNVAIMPNDSVRWFDVEVEEVLADPRALLSHPRNPIQRDVMALGALMATVCGPGEQELADFFRRVAQGGLTGPSPLCDSVAQLLAARGEAAPKERVGAFTDVGTGRAVNEDRWGWRDLSERVQAYVVADGMGGHARGEVAAQRGVEVVLDILEHALDPQKVDTVSVEKLLGEAMVAANLAVRELVKKTGVRMGCALAAMVVIDRSILVVANAGDVRGYVLDGPKLTQMTTDHSLAAAMVERGKLKKGDVRGHPQASTLLVALGLEDELDYDIKHFKVSPKARVLLCTDGLWGPLPDEDLKAGLMMERNQRIAVYRMVRDAINAGGSDNVAAIIIDMK